MQRKHEIEIVTTVDVADLEEGRLIDLANWILNDEKCPALWRIAIIFVDDRFISELNIKFLQKSGPTDVISFNLSDSESEPDGEIYISVETASRNAKDYNVELTNELYRLAAHGLYHLLDYGDADPQQRREMTRLENKALEYIESTL